MTASAAHPPRDVYIAGQSSVSGWGGGIALTLSLQEAFAADGQTTLVLGVNDRAGSEPELAPEITRLDVPSGVSRRLWRVRNWFLPHRLARSLRKLPPPARAFVTVSPTLVPAAKRAWPDVPVVFVFACLLNNCLPFTWERRVRPSFWAGVDFSGIRRAEQLALALADAILTPTQQARDEILAFHPAARERVVVYRGGFEPSDVSRVERAAYRRELGVNDEAVVFMIAGVCDRNKAVDLAVRALPSVDTRGHLVIVGDGPELASLGSLAAEQHVARRVHILGQKPDVGPWHAAADCVVSTSWYDSFPTTIKEAMSRGRPVLVPRHSAPEVYAGMAEVIANDGGGLLYNRMLPGGLAAAMNRMIRNPQLREELGARARQVADERSGYRGIVDHTRRVGGLPPATPQPDTEPATSDEACVPSPQGVVAWSEP